MITAKIIVTVLLSCFLELLPVFGNSFNLNGETHREVSAESQALNDFGNDMELNLTEHFAKPLANAIILNNAEAVKILYTDIQNKNNNLLLSSLIIEVIKQIVSMESLSLSYPDLIWRIYRPNDQLLFEIMLRLLLELYRNIMETFKTFEDLMDFLEKLSYRLYTARKENMYNMMDLNLRKRVDNIIDQLPENLRFLFFETPICLWNPYVQGFFRVIKYQYQYYNFINRCISDTKFTAEFKQIDLPNGKQELRVNLKSQWYDRLFPFNKQIGFMKLQTYSYNSFIITDGAEKLCVQYRSLSKSFNVVMKHDNNLFNLKCQWQLRKCIDTC